MTGPVLEFDALVLALGAHGTVFDGEACLVECSNLIAAGRVHVPGWTPRCPLAAVSFVDDHPSISRVIRRFAIGLNDAWTDTDRQRLKPYATRILCTATTDADEDTRRWLAVDWMVRVYAPAFLRLVGLIAQADALASLPQITDAPLASAARPTIAAAARMARDAARHAAAVGDAAWEAAVDAVWEAAGGAARAVAREADWAADVAWEAALDAAAADAARDAAVHAAGTALAPVVTALQSSALELLDAMIAVGQPEAVS